MPQPSRSTSPSAAKRANTKWACSDRRDEPIVQTQGTATSSNQSVILQIDLDLSSVAPGEYLLGFRRPEFSWHYHVVKVEE